MPSAKPDSREIDFLLRKRKAEAPESIVDLYTELHAQCLATIEDGFTSSERAKVLLDYLLVNPEVAAIYPNNLLTHFLQNICTKKDWIAECEHDLLNLICSFYVGYENIGCRIDGISVNARFSENGFQFTSETVIAKPTPPVHISSILSDLEFKTSRLDLALLFDYIDCLQCLPDLKDKFVGFTGKFKFGSRNNCFEEARKHGAVPCNPAPYMDYLFISNDHEQNMTISSKIEQAIFYRRIYGRPLVLNERAWLAIINR